MIRQFCSYLHTPRDSYRYCVQWALVNGRRVNVEALCADVASRVFEMPHRPHQISCTAVFDEDGLDVSSLKVWLDTETHGRWAMNETTREVKRILVKEYGGFVPWYKE